MNKEDLEALRDAAVDGSDGRVRKANKEVLKDSVTKLDKAILEYDNKALKTSKEVKDDVPYTGEDPFMFAREHNLTLRQAKLALGIDSIE